MPFKSEKQRKWMHINNPKMAKKWEKKEKMKKETKVRQLIKKMVREVMAETTVRLSTHKDASFEPGRFVAILGKKGRVKLDKKSVHKLAKIIRSSSREFGMGWSFTEGKLNEFDAKMQKNHFLNLIKQELESKKGQLKYAEDKIRYHMTPKWERKEWLAVAKDLKKEIRNLKIRVKKVSKMKEGKLKEYRIRGNADNLLIRKGDIKKGMMVWFEDGKGSAKKLKVKHVMLSKDGKEEHYITNKGTFTPRDVVGY